MEEWKECRLKDICDYGKDRIEVSSLDNSNYISTENMFPNRAGIAIATTLPTGELTPSFEIDDTLVSNIRPYFKKIWKATFSGGCSADVLVFKAKENVSKEYLHYVLADDEFFKYSMTTSKGTKMPRGDKTSIMNYPVKLPPLSTQQKIATILSSLDDKIELNNKINTNLEQQAQALFKNWFIDFEPFGGKMPEGWKEAEFRDVCENITDGVHNTVVDDPNGDYLLLSCKNIKGGVLTISSSERKINKDTFEKLRKRTKLAKGDILLSSVGTVGEMYLLNETPDNYEFQRSVAIIKPNTSLISPAFLYESMLFQKDTIIHSAHGAVQQCIFISDVGDFTTILPTIDIIEKFTKIVQPMLDTITANQHENQKLANFRDTLLPKLMNGEIEVDKVEL